MNIFIDTSFILTALKYRLDIFEEFKKLDFKYDLYVLDKTLGELKNKKLGKLAIDLIKKKNIKVKKTNNKKNVDYNLLKLKNCIIATQDKALIEKLKKKKIKTIRIRQKKYIENVLWNNSWKSYKSTTKSI